MPMDLDRTGRKGHINQREGSEGSGAESDA